MNTKALRRGARWLWYSFSALVLFYLVVPITIVVPLSFSKASFLQFPPVAYSTRWYEQLFQDPLWFDSISNSLKIGLMATTLSIVVGTMAAMALSQIRFRGQGAITGLLLSSMIIPQIITAIAMYFLFAEWRLIGNSLALVAGHTVLGLPFVFINVSASLQAFDYRLEHAALSLGATPWRAFRRVKLPLILPGMLSGGFFTFVLSFNELVVALFLAGPNRTLPIQMWNGIRVQITPAIAAASTLLLGSCVLIYVLYEFSIYGLRRRQKGGTT